MTTLSTWSEQHLATCVAPATRKNYARVQRDFITWVGDDDLGALSLTNARAYLIALRTAGLAESTIKLYGTCLKVWTSWLEAEEEVADNPLRKLKLGRVHKPVIEIFTPGQIQTLLGVADIRERALLYFALDTMVRSHELRAATIPPDLDLGGGWMTILGKGKKERRVHYDAATATAVCDYLATRQDKQPWLFLHRKEQFGEFTFLRILQSIGVRANIRGVRCSPHTCRHTGAVRFLQAHPDNLAQLKLRLGHETLDMTLRYATRATEESILSDNGTSALDLLGLT